MFRRLAADAWKVDESRNMIQNHGTITSSQCRFGLTEVQQCRAQSAPCVDVVRLQFDGPSKVCNGFLESTERNERHPAIVEGRRACGTHANDFGEQPQSGLIPTSRVMSSGKINCRVDGLFWRHTFIVAHGKAGCN